MVALVGRAYGQLQRHVGAAVLDGIVQEVEEDILQVYLASAYPGLAGL